MTAPDSTDKISGPKAPGALSEVVMACHDKMGEQRDHGAEERDPDDGGSCDG